MDSNCHLHWLITQNRKEIRFFVLELKNDDQIVSLEEQFIMKYKPEWNQTLKDS